MPLAVRRSYHFYLLGIIVLAGAWLRLADIGTESIWTDEMYSVHWANKSLAQIFDNASSDVHPPLYYALLHFWQLSFGTSETAVRGLSALCSILTIPLLYSLGRRMFGVKAGLCAALLLAVSHFHIYYAQEARNYALTVLCVVWGMDWFVRILHLPADVPQRQKWWAFAGYILSNIFLMHTHLFALFVMVAQNLYIASLLVFDRESFRRLLKRWIVLQTILFLLFLPWFRILLHQILAVGRQGFWIEEPTAFTLPETLVEYAGSFWLLVIMLVLVMLAFVNYERSQHSQAPNKFFTSLFTVIERPTWTLSISGAAFVWMLLLWFIMPIAIPLAKSFLSKPPIYYIKYTIPALPALLLLAGKGMAVIRSKTVLVCYIVLIVALSLNETRDEWNTLNKERWREAAQILDSMATPDDAILVHQWYYEWSLEYYCRKPHPLVQAVPSQYLAFRRDIVERLMQPALQHKRVWLVLGQKNYAHYDLILETLHRSGFVGTQERTIPSYYRKYFIKDVYPQNTIISLLKTYQSPHIELMLFEKSVDTTSSTPQHP